MQAFPAYRLYSLTSPPWQSGFPIKWDRASGGEIERIRAASGQRPARADDPVMGIEIALGLGNDRGVVMIGLEAPAGLREHRAITK